MIPEQFTNYVILINKYLEQALPAAAVPPKPIFEAMRYSLFAGGKRLRPILTLSVTETLGAEAERILPVAAAIEMVHTYSLIHDDLPSMDNDDLRRGKPTNHKVFGEAIAILAGDALLTAGFEQIVTAPYPPEICRQLAIELSDSIGPEGMIGGQVLDMAAQNEEVNVSQLEKMHLMKTAALLSYSAFAPAIALEAGEEVEDALHDYGESIGLAFQIVDDILDVEGNSEDLGKTAGKDHHNRKATYPSILGVEKSRKHARESIEKAIASVESIDRYSYLSTLATFILERKK